MEETISCVGKCTRREGEHADVLCTVKGKKSKKPSSSEVLAALQAVGKFPVEKRRSVRKSATDKKEGFVLGYVLNYMTGWCASRMTCRYPGLAKLLCRYMRSHDPKFKFTSIMVNKGTSALHVDSINCGPSYIVSLGKHTGGELWQYADAKAGQVLKIKDKFTLTNGLLPHMTLPYSGERFSLVFYSNKGERKMPKPEQANFLKRLGFNSPKQRGACSDPARSDLLPAAAVQLKAILLRKGLSASAAKAAIGDYTNKSIPRSHG